MTTSVATLSLDALTTANRPVQLELLERLADMFTRATSVTDLLVRGSLATGTADRLSDVDLVIGIHDDQLPAMLEQLDALMNTAFGAVLPGWRDTIVADLGGAGTVHLIPHGGRLHQVDLYLAPTSAVATLRARTGARPIFQREPATPPTLHETELAARKLAATRAQPPSCTELLTEAVVLHAMLAKRIMRGQRFIAHGLLHQAHCTLRDLIRTALIPNSRHHGWYHLPDEVGASPLGAWCLGELTRELEMPALPSLTQADDLLDRTWRVAERIAPHAADVLRDGLAAYRLYQEPHT